MKGTIKKDKFKESGFGFIIPDNGGPDMFLHVRDLQEGYNPDDLAEGVVVEYEVGEGRDGRQKAINVRIVDGANTSSEDDME
jgi:cold shock protein